MPMGRKLDKMTQRSTYQISSLFQQCHSNRLTDISSADDRQIFRDPNLKGMSIFLAIKKIKQE